jgi:hypothetical protein
MLLVMKKVALLFPSLRLPLKIINNINVSKLTQLHQLTCSFRPYSRIQKCYYSLQTSTYIRGLFKNYPTFGREKYIYTPGDLQT